jgi:hypothetical protein
MRHPVRGRPWLAGGVVGYPLDRLHEEVAFIAYYCHWPLADILQLEHADRQRWVDEISAINHRLRQQTEELVREEYG